MASQLRLNEPVTFGKAGSIRGMDPYGFDLSEAFYSWTQAEVAGFSTMLAGPVPIDALLRLHVAARPFIQTGHVERQQFFVFVNGLFVGFRTLVVAEKINFPLPRSVLSPRGLRIEFVVPTASSPQSVGTSPDVRRLGVALEHLWLAVRK